MFSEQTEISRDSTFGVLLGEKRRSVGLSQEQLAEKIGKSTNTVSRYENDDSLMDVLTFEKTVNALGICPGDLLANIKVPEMEKDVSRLLFLLNRLDKAKRKVVLTTMETMIKGMADI